MNFSDEEMAAISKSMIDQKTAPATTTTTEPPATTDPPATNTTTTTDPPVTSSLTDAEKETARLAAEAAANTATQPPPSKSFEEYLEEKTQGKFKKWDEVEQIINTPREELDEEIKHFQTLKKNGVKLDKEFFELQALDVDNMTDPEQIVLEAMRRKPENKNLSDKTLRTAINKKYNVEEWIGKEEADLTDDDQANREIMMRDAQNDVEWLTNLKKERTFVAPALTAEQLKAQSDSQREAQENWEKYVDGLETKTLNLTTVIDETTKESFEFKLSDADRKRVGGMMKLLPKDIMVVFNQFAEKDAEGKLQINQQKVFEMLIKNIIHDDAVKTAYRDGKAVGAKTFVKDDLKNINFKAADSSTGQVVAQNEAEALAIAMKADGKKFT